VTGIASARRVASATASASGIRRRGVITESLAVLEACRTAPDVRGIVSTPYTPPGHDPLASSALTEDRMSKKTAKRKLRSRRNKANHGKRPNSGRR
jgi:hypothetical protein